MNEPLYSMKVNQLKEETISCNHNEKERRKMEHNVNEGASAVQSVWVFE
jgi:hypothetical protein